MITYAVGKGQILDIQLGNKSINDLKAANTTRI